MSFNGGFTPRHVEGYAVESSVRDASVTRESAGFFAPGQSAKTLCGRYAIANGASLTAQLHKVPTGKVFLVSDIQVSYDTAVQYDVQLQSGSIAIFRQVLKGDTAPCEMPGMETQPAVLQGQTLQLVLPAVTGATNVDFVISGFEQAIGVG